MNKPRAISYRVWGRQNEIRARFLSGVELDKFVIVPDFLSAAVFEEIYNFAITAPLEHYCVYSKTREPIHLEDEYRAPVHGFYYLTAHKRMRPEHCVPATLQDLVGCADMLAFLGNLTDLSLSALELPSTLTGWGPGGFLGEHCDEGDPERPTKLVVSLSLTSRWSSEYGGTTHYKWRGREAEVIVQPKCNVATIFQPGEHSVHWVSPISDLAPEGQRFTWTLDYY